MQSVKSMAENNLDDWVSQTEQSKIRQQMKMVMTIKAYRRDF